MKLKNLYDLNDSIFTDLQTLDIPWKNDNIASKLDIEYMGNISGNKTISPLVEQFVEDDELSSESRATIASVVYALNIENWARLYATLSREYNPMEDYSLREQMTNDRTVTAFGKTSTRTDNLSHTKTGTEQTGYASTDTRTDNLTHAKAGSEVLTYNTTDTRTDNLTHTKAGEETLTHDTTDTRTDNLTHTIEGGEVRTPNTKVSNSVVAFNSSEPALTSASDNSGTETTQFLNRNDKNTGTSANAKTGTEKTSFNGRTDTDAGTSALAKTGTDTTSFNNRQDTDTGTSALARTGTDTLTHNTTEADTGTSGIVEGGSDTATRNYLLEKSGGMKAPQELIDMERKTWLWNFFYRVVFPDVDRVLTINIY